MPIDPEVTVAANYGSYNAAVWQLLDAAPNVGRVIFIASRGFGGLVGRGASLLVEPTPEQAAMYKQLIRDNPGAFNPQFQNRLPTSVDILQPQSVLLAVMSKMRMKDCLPLNTAIGLYMPLSLDGPSDGIVSVRSDSHPDCDSVLAYHAAHSTIHRELHTSCEIARILRPHAESARSTTLPTSGN